MRAIVGHLAARVGRASRKSSRGLSLEYDKTCIEVAVSRAAADVSLGCSLELAADSDAYFVIGHITKGSVCDGKGGLRTGDRLERVNGQPVSARSTRSSHGSSQRWPGSSSCASRCCAGRASTGPTPTEWHYECARASRPAGLSREGSRGGSPCKKKAPVEKKMRCAQRWPLVGAGESEGFIKKF